MPSPRLIVRLPNWIGDCVMATPALWALHERGVALQCVGRAWAPTLLAGCPWPTRALPTGPWRRQARALRRIAAGDANSCLLLTHSFSTAAIARLAGLRPIGFARDGRGPLLAGRVRWPRGVHEVRRYALLAEHARRRLSPATAPLPRSPGDVHLPLAPQAACALAPAWRAAGLGERCVLLCPVATGTVHGRDKHYPHFPELARHLGAAGHAPAVLAPPGRAAELRARFPELPLLADLDMAGFMAALARAAVVVANDSGPMHVAAAVGTPVVTPFGVTRPQWTGAWSRQLYPVGDGSAWPPVPAMASAVERALAATG